MQMRRRMLLNDEAKALQCGDLCVAARLRRLREIPLGAVFCQQLFDHDAPSITKPYGTESSRCG